VSGFSADWLALREPYDRAARSAVVLDAVKAAFVDRASLSVVDLACGTGSTLRALTAHLPARQEWRLADNDLGLLLRAGQASISNVKITTVPVDLARDLEAALDGPIEFVTTSALLDLVSPAWLERFVFETAARKLPVYAALSYDGRISLDPADRLDSKIVAAVNRHQRTDKGFGPSLGPAAAAEAVGSFERLGYSLVQGRSDWVFGPDDRDIQLETVAGWAGAARDIGDLSLGDIANWLVRRREAIAAGRSSLRVGHVDFFASPPQAR
jgi:hypothetical protein